MKRRRPICRDPTGFTEDKWVQSAEARPGNREVTHHIIAFVREPGSKWLAGAQPGDDSSVPTGELLVGYAPGITPVALNPGQAKLVKAGSDLVLQMHYTANGKPATDRSRIGVIFAKEKPAQRYDFNWQLFYYLEQPLLLPKGTRIECTAHFDNSPNNPANPDPKAEVRWGDQSWEEMMIGRFDVTIDPKRNPGDYLRKKKPAATD